MACLVAGLSCSRDVVRYSIQVGVFPTAASLKALPANHSDISALMHTVSYDLRTIIVTLNQSIGVPRHEMLSANCM